MLGAVWTGTQQNQETVILLHKVKVNLYLEFHI